MNRTTHNTSTSKRGAAPLPSKIKRRLSAKMRRAIELHVRECLPIKKACEMAGMSEANWHARMKLQHNADALEQEKQQLVHDVAKMKAPYKAAAIQHAVWLMKEAQSEAVQARMVEFLAGETAKGVQITQQINVAAGGYEFAPPGSRVVDITPSPDSQSGDTQEQAIDNEED